MKIKLPEIIDSLKIIDKNSEVFLMRINKTDKFEIADLIGKYGDEVDVATYMSSGGGRLKVSFGIESYIFCVPERTVDKVKRIFNATLSGLN